MKQNSVVPIMANCLKCGTPSAPDARVCTECGQTLAHAAAPLSKTMLGMSSPFAQPGQQGSPLPAADRLSPPHAESAAQKSMLGGTMIGMPSPVLTGPDVSRPEANKSSHIVSPPAKFKGTLLGIAQPGIAPRDPRDQPAPAPPRLTPIIGTPTSPVPQQGGPGPHALHSEEAGLSSTGLAANPSTSATPAPRLQFNQGPDSLRRSSAPPPRTRAFWKNALFVGFGLLSAAGLGAFAASLSAKPLQILVTQYTFNQDGKDQLNLMCAGCANGTVLMLDGSKATVQDEKTILITDKEIRVGRNELNFSAHDAAGRVLETKAVILPIAYRQKASWAGQHAPVPYVEVIVEAPTGSKVELDGKHVELQNNIATYRVDLGDHTLGEATKVEPLVLAIPISVTVDGKPRSAQASLKSNITPLQLTSIGSLHELKGKPVTIQGRTAAGATVVIDGAKLQADADGGFSHTLTSPAVDKILVASYTERLVARRVEISLVSDAPIAPEAVTEFADLQVGLTARLRATVLESRIDKGVTVTLLEMTSGCSAGPCLIRTVFPEPHTLRAGQAVTVSGRIEAGEPMTIRVTEFL